MTTAAIWIVYLVAFAALLVAVIARQVRERTLTVRSAMALPAAFAVAAFVLDHTMLHRLASPLAAAIFVLGLLAGAATGLIRAGTMAVRRVGETMVTRGNGRTVAWWVVSLLIRVGLVVGAGSLGLREGAGEAMLFLAVTLGVQNAALAWRAGLLGRAAPVATAVPVAATEVPRFEEVR